jgi:hypothetical protein
MWEFILINMFKTVIKWHFQLKIIMIVKKKKVKEKKVKKEKLHSKEFLDYCKEQNELFNEIDKQV